jgi:hypothetical protein
MEFKARNHHRINPQSNQKKNYLKIEIMRFGIFNGGHHKLYSLKEFGPL